MIFGHKNLADIPSKHVTDIGYIRKSDNYA